MPFWLPSLISFCLTAVVLWALLRTELAYRFAMDHPNARSLHARPVPRIGGLVAMPIALGCALAAGAPLLLSTTALLLCLLSYVDDRWNLPIAIRFGAHLGAAFAIAAMEVQFPLLLLFVLAIGWMTNLYNFMDGSDGLAGGMALIGFATYGIAATGAPDVALLSFIVAAAAAGFLVFNFHPARVFMGDAGSIPLGFLAGGLGLVGWQLDAWPAWFPALVFSPFIVDASITLLRRALRRERVWQAHREHYYQRLVRMGWGHRRTALAEYAVMLAAGGSALFLMRLPVPSQWLGLSAWAAIYAVLAWRIDRAWAARAP
jgi:UDP-N-acetylmuramyl pentapeptide phosphotransferase/UDP-N-acetylglucosamine-1-phosphate transferase